MIAEIASGWKIKAHRGGAETLRTASIKVNMSAAGEGACAPQIEMYGKPTRSMEEVECASRLHRGGAETLRRARIGHRQECRCHNKIGDIARD